MTVLLSLVCTCITAKLVFAQSLLHDNGTFTTGAGIDVCPDATPPANTSSPTGTSTTLGTQSFWVLRRQIDDFTVPAGQSWTLNSLRWRAYQTGTLFDELISEAYVRLWNENPTLGGTPLTGDFTTNRLSNSFFSGVFRTAANDLTNCDRGIKNVDIDLSDFPKLPPGTYWIEVGLAGDLPGGLFSPPTEPRAVGDNALQLDFLGVAQPVTDDESGLPLEYPYQLFGTSGPDVLRACVLPDESCLDTTLGDCTNIHNGQWNFFNVCTELGACCNHATGGCIENVGPESCTGIGFQFSPGVACSAVPGCGLINGACCFPEAIPVDCQPFTRGIHCVAQGGFWHPGSCSAVSCEDFCETAGEVFEGDTLFDITGYSTDGPTTPNRCNDPFVGQSDLWFRYVSSLANSGGSIVISLCTNTTFNSTLQVYQVDENTTCDELMQTASAVYCDIDGCSIPGGPSELTVSANPGDQFLIRIGGYDGDQGNGTLRISKIEAGFGACCLLSGSCKFTDEASCLADLGAFFPASSCGSPGFTCPPVGACCRGTEGCVVTFDNTCILLGGTFLGQGEACGPADDCDNDGETDFCAIINGSSDCNENGVPDDCDIAPGGASTDCDQNMIPDRCQQEAFCCRGDVNGDSVCDALDIQGFVEGMLSAAPPCFERPFCRLDTNEDFQLDQNDIVGFVEALLNDVPCPILVHVSGSVIVLDEQGQDIGRDNKVFMLDQTGELIYSYDQVPMAISDNFGYRDGASDGTFLYFGWLGGVARHDYDGGNGTQIIVGPVPNTGTTWRALAYDPTGDHGSGSLWTQSFTSDLVETDLAGNLLNQFANDLSLYGLAYDHQTGMLWGHSVDENNGALVVEIDPKNGLPTGVSFSSHYNVPGASDLGFALYGGLHLDEQSRTFYGLVQGTPDDGIFSADISGVLTGPLMPNLRTDINQQSGTLRNLGIVISRP